MCPRRCLCVSVCVGGRGLWVDDIESFLSCNAHLGRQIHREQGVGQEHEDLDL